MANQFQLWRQTNATGLASNQPASPFNNAETALISAPVDPRQLYLPQIIVINALLIISASVQLRDPTFQNQQVRQQPLVNTSQGSPRALLSSTVVTLPSGKQQLASAPAFVYQPVDTSHGTPPPLLSSLKPLLTVQHAEPIENDTQLWDTSRGSDITLLTAVVATKPPFVHPSQAPIRSAYQPLDTSQGTPKPLYSDALFAPTNLTEQFSIIQRFGIGLDTSAGTPLTLRATPTAAPFIPVPQTYANRINWKGLDTSQGTFPALFPVTAAPFTPFPWLSAPNIEWQPADSSQRSPQALLNPAPFVPAQHVVPVQINWKAADTSQSSPIALLTPLAIPFTAPPHQQPIANTTQPADTTHGTPQPLLALLFVKPFNQNDWPSPIEYRVTWLQQWTFYGQNPDNIPPAPPPPPPPPAETPGGATIGDSYVRAILEQQARELNEREQHEADRHQRESTERTRVQPEPTSDKATEQALEPVSRLLKPSRAPAHIDLSSRVEAVESAIERQRANDALAAQVALDQAAERQAKFDLIAQQALTLNIQINLAALQDEDDLDAILALLLIL